VHPPSDFMRHRVHPLVPTYTKRTARRVIIAQSSVSPSVHDSHRSDSNVNVLRLYSPHSLGRKVPHAARWAIDVSEKHEKWTANTLTTWLHGVSSALRERPPKKIQLELPLLTHVSRDNSLRRRNYAIEDKILRQLVQ
jgi:hypothetical protein